MPGVGATSGTIIGVRAFTIMTRHRSGRQMGPPTSCPRYGQKRLLTFPPATGRTTRSRLLLAIMGLAIVELATSTSDLVGDIAADEGTGPCRVEIAQEVVIADGNPGMEIRRRCCTVPRIRASHAEGPAVSRSRGRDQGLEFPVQHGGHVVDLLEAELSEERRGQVVLHAGLAALVLVDQHAQGA